jgi:hypothetical protein
VCLQRREKKQNDDDVGRASALVTFICDFCTLRTQISRKFICNFTHYRRRLPCQRAAGWPASLRRIQ